MNSNAVDLSVHMYVFVKSDILYGWENLLFVIVYNESSHENINNLKTLFFHHIVQKKCQSCLNKGGGAQNSINHCDITHIYLSSKKTSNSGYWLEYFTTEQLYFLWGMKMKVFPGGWHLNYYTATINGQLCSVCFN